MDVFLTSPAHIQLLIVPRGSSKNYKSHPTTAAQPLPAALCPPGNLRGRLRFGSSACAAARQHRAAAEVVPAGSAPMLVPSWTFRIETCYSSYSYRLPLSGSPDKTCLQNLWAQSVRLKERITDVGRVLGQVTAEGVTVPGCVLGSCQHPCALR